MIADPAPLGLVAFALTTFLLSLVKTATDATEPSCRRRAGHGGGCAGRCMWRFRKGNVFGATAFTPNRLLAVVLGLCRLLRKRYRPRATGAGSRLVPDGVGGFTTLSHPLRTTAVSLSVAIWRGVAQLRLLASNPDDRILGSPRPRQPWRGTCAWPATALTFGRPILPTGHCLRVSLGDRRTDMRVSPIPTHLF